MKSKILLAILFTLIFSPTTFSQNPTKESISVKGIIIQQENNLPLSYVSIGVLNKSIGTLTDTLGNFSFQVSQQNLADTLQISLVGYFPKKIVVKNFIERKENTIRLSIKIIELAEVSIIKSKTNTETIGRQSNAKFIQVSIHNKKSVEETIGSEMGMRFKTKNTNTSLKDFSFNLSGNNFNYIKYRINIYAVKDNMPDTLIYNKQIFKTVDNFKTGWIKVDLEPYHIQVPQDFIVTVQWVESRMDKKESPITLLPVAKTFFSKNCYARIASQDKWKRLGMNLSSFVTLSY
ncbi:carboxypeptidase-like regulatory domain-containing protein [Emticicia soli]|uniref:Carboxypeptidase-like regulatory domain-containing protein n=1 Tax=Emticicia soli TaxID=2027878 RepID=A0ABW5J3Z0_9BACT